jgi:hypothetical protein
MANEPEATRRVGRQTGLQSLEDGEQPPDLLARDSIMGSSSTRYTCRCVTATTSASSRRQSPYSMGGRADRSGRDDRTVKAAAPIRGHRRAARFDLGAEKAMVIDKRSGGSRWRH